METQQTVDEIKDLKACLNDLIAVLALPAIWSIHEPSQIVSTLLETLVGMLRLDFAYVRLGDSFDRGATIEMARFIQSQNVTLRPQEIGQALTPWFGGWATIDSRRAESDRRRRNLDLGIPAGGSG